MMIYTEEQLKELMSVFTALPAETERLEFKESNELDNTKIGTYFSALSNEANLKGKNFGRLILGVNDKNHTITGTTFREGDRKRLDDLKQAIFDLCGRSFVEIYEIYIDEKRVVMLQIPPTLAGSVTTCNGHAYGRNGEHIGALDDFKRKTIESQIQQRDRTSEFVESLTIDDMDDEAIALAKKGYIQQHKDLEDAVKGRDKKTFLTKVYALQNEQITRAGAILFGKEEVITPLFPWLEMSWILKDEQGNKLSHEHFKAPFILSAEKIIKKIRIINNSILIDSGLMPMDIPSYDEWILRELVANAICHQDYSLGERIGIQEFPSYLVISNGGNFYAGSIEQVVMQEYFMPSSYKNPCLKNTMSEINMIEYAGSGLKKIFTKQWERYMPLPEDLSTDKEVKIRIEGKIIDEKYTKLLHNREDLTLSDIIYLDKIQKGDYIDQQKIKDLKRKKLIEGRKGRYYISLGVAQKIGKVSDYLNIKGPELEYQRQTIYQFIEANKNNGVEKKEVVGYMDTKIGEGLDDACKTNRVANLLQDLRRDGKIYPSGKGARARWFPMT